MPTAFVLTRSQIDEIRASLAAVTPGPWAPSFPYVVQADPVAGARRIVFTNSSRDDSEGEANTAFIAAAPSNTLNLLATVDHLIDKNAQLQKENAYLKACVPPTKPSDYGHEAWTEALREAVAQERAAVVAYLRDGDGYAPSDYADWIERGDHLEAE